MMKVPKIELNDGNKMPMVAFGTWQVNNRRQCVESVVEALKLGYRHIDTAQIYGNEQYVGEALKISELAREEVFITTKISINNFLRVQKSFDDSLKKLQTDYVDLLLLHFPLTAIRKKAWQDLEVIQESGGARSIGVSNYTIRHLEQMFKYTKIKPAVNQVELHVYLQQPELLEFCEEHEIVVEAYSPLARGHDFENEVLKEIATNHKKSSAQIMLRWCVEQGAVPLPKSVTPERIKENLGIFDFELTVEELKKLKTLNKNLRTCWNPTLTP